MTHYSQRPYLPHNLISRSYGRRGFSLIEVIVVFALSASLATFGFVQLQKQKQQGILNNAIADHNAIIAAWRSYNGATLNIGSGNALSQLSAANALPADVTNVSGVWLNAFRGTFTMNGNANLSNGVPGVQMTYNNVPAFACMRFVSALAPSAYSTYINGSSLQIRNPATTSSTINYSQASTLCSSGPSYTIEFDYLLPMPIITLFNGQNPSSASAYQLNSMTNFMNALSARPSIIP